VNGRAEGRGTVDVTVVVPMFESAGTVRATVESVLADFDASRVGGEVVVVNDGSKDAGPVMVAEMAARDGRVRLVHRENGGLSAARNTGIERAAGRFLRFLDADDLAIPGGLAWLLAAAQRTGAACGGQELIDEGGRSMGREISPRAGGVGVDRAVGLSQLVSGNAMGVGAVLVSRELLGERRFDESLPVCEDWDLWLRLAGGSGETEGVCFAALPAWRGPVKRYRVRPGSLSKRFALMHETGARVLGKVEDVDVGPGLLGLATGYGAMQALAGDVEGGLAMLRGHSPRGLAAAHLATDAFAAVLLGLGMRPEERGARRAEWVARLVRWWDRLVAAGWADATSVDAAWRELARLVVAPGAVAAACVKEVRAVGGRSAVVVGLGKNGRRVVEALHETAVPWTVRDDGVAAGSDPEPPHWRPMDEAFATDAAVIVTPEQDDALLSAIGRLGGKEERVIRWRDVLGNLAAAEGEDLREAQERSVASDRPKLRCA
jgi:hypothetical protein